ncbi:uncharacterized protein LOC132700077 [Cylas formicarius]|uniref:uncharacterized protein LOC132700077 n=1 Tax=Cylas formicarius TaxID=197179 RepID=UPI0029587623|nr:uncharacterized protein LOC132700077 [Cylas formicarius]
MNLPEHICRLCLHDFSGPPNNLGDNTKLHWMLKGVLTGLDIQVTESPKVCPECFKYVKFAYHIKGTVISNEHKIIENIKLARRIQEKTCRLCFKLGAKKFIALYNCDQPLPFTEIRNIIEVAVAEINFHLYKKPVICNNCWQIVRAMYLFKKRCWIVEKLLKYYCINNKVDVLKDQEVINISKCYMSHVKKYFENNRVIGVVKEKIAVFRQKTRHIDLLQIEKRIFEGPSLIRFFKNGASFIDKLIKPIDQANFTSGGNNLKEATAKDEPPSKVLSVCTIFKGNELRYSDRVDGNFIFENQLPEIKEEIFEEIYEREECCNETETNDVIDINDLILEFSNSLNSDDEFSMDFASFNTEHYAYIQDLQDFLDSIWPQENSICIDDMDRQLHQAGESQLNETMQLNINTSTPKHQIAPKNSKMEDQITANTSQVNCPLLERTLFNLDKYGEVSVFQRKSSGTGGQQKLTHVSNQYSNTVQSSKKWNQNLKLFNSIRRDLKHKTDIDGQKNIKENAQNKIAPLVPSPLIISTQIERHTSNNDRKEIKNFTKHNGKICETECQESTQKTVIESNQICATVETAQPKGVEHTLASPALTTIIPKCNGPLNDSCNLKEMEVVSLKPDNKKQTMDIVLQENKSNNCKSVVSEQINCQSTVSTKEENDQAASNDNGQVNITNVITINGTTRTNFSGATVTMNIEFSDQKSAETVPTKTDPPKKNEESDITDQNSEQIKYEATNNERSAEQCDPGKKSIDNHKYEYECNNENIVHRNQKIATMKTSSLKIKEIRSRNNNQDTEGTNGWHCDVCPFKTKYKQHLTRHMKLHDDNAKSLDCPKCLYSTKIKRNFLRHMAVHTSSKALQCPNCDFNTTDRTALKNHTCLKDEDERGSLVKRENSKTGKIDLGFEYTCPECPYVTARQEQYVAHCRAHKSTEKVYKCDKCYYITSIKDHMQLHDQSKGKIYRYKCEYCSLTCKKRTHLVSHMLVHEGSYKFECSECHYKAKRKSHLVTHMLQHQRPEKVLKFQCLHCPYKAKRKEHLRIHTQNVHCTQQAISLNSMALTKEENCSDVILLESDTYTKKSIQCPLCSYQIKCNWSLWIKHLSEVHYPSRTDYFECAKCTHKSTSRRHFIHHLKLHRN